MRTFLLTTFFLGAATVASAQDALPRQLPSASPPPPSVTARPTVAPPANAVALCSDQTFVVAPQTPEACTARGGLKLILPFRATPSAPPGAQPSQSATPPADATMRCKDGTWLSGTPAASRCDANGGLATVLPPTPPPGAPPRRP
jgi:hypothetical protein